MAKKLYEESSVQAIADAIRVKNGGTKKYKIAEMATAIAAIEGGAETEVYTFNQERAEVSKFLSEVTYDPSDYTISSIDNYITKSSANHPEGITILMKSAGTLIVVDGNTNNVFSKTITEGPITIYNCTPGVDSKFILVDNSNNIVQQGIIKPTGTCRMIHMTNADNVRDFGGWACDGGTVKYGRLFRGGEVYGYLTEDGTTQAIDMLGILKEIDLRFDSDLNGRTASGFGNPVDMLHVDFSWYDLKYQKTSGNIKKVFDSLFDWVAEGKPTYVHCSAGADRTGVVALLCEAVLGMFQSDIDKDYELTNFFTGITPEGNARRRNKSVWTREINIINSYSGATFRDKAVNYMVSCGIAIEKINAFRAAMIDGTPDILTADINTYTVANTLTKVSSDNTATTTKQYQPYIANINAESGAIIESVTIKMDNTDITSESWHGIMDNLYREVTYNLTGCFIDNNRSGVIDGQSYAATISSDAGYTLNGAEVLITMGGIDVSTYYSGGKIVIPSVTGNLSITINAVKNGYVPNILTDSFKIGTTTYAAVGYENGQRLSTSTGLNKPNADSCVTGFIPVKAGAVIRIKPLAAPADAGIGQTAIGFYNAAKTDCLAMTYILTSIASTTWGNCTWEQESENVYKMTCNSDFSSNYAYVKFTIPVADGANAYVTYNMEMPNSGA